MKYRIFADFNNKITDKLGAKVFICNEESWQHFKIPSEAIFEQGQQIRLFDGEIEVLSTLDFDKSIGAWYGRPDWSTLRNLKSRSDGLEVYRDANSKQKLEILRYELTPLITSIRGYVDLVETGALMEVFMNAKDSNKSLSNLSRTVNDLEEILEFLTKN